MSFLSGGICSPPSIPHMLLPEVVRAWGHLEVDETEAWPPPPHPGPLWAPPRLPPLPEGQAVAEVRALPGGRGGVEGRMQSGGGEGRAKRRILPQWSGCSSSLFFLLNTHFISFWIVLLCICKGEPGGAGSPSSLPVLLPPTKCHAWDKGRAGRTWG